MIPTRTPIHEWEAFRDVPKVPNRWKIGHITDGEMIPLSQPLRNYMDIPKPHVGARSTPGPSLTDKQNMRFNSVRQREPKAPDARSLATDFGHLTDLMQTTIDVDRARSGSIQPLSVVTDKRRQREIESINPNEFWISSVEAMVEGALSSLKRFKASRLGASSSNQNAYTVSMKVGSGELTMTSDDGGPKVAFNGDPSELPKVMEVINNAKSMAQENEQKEDAVASTQASKSAATSQRVAQGWSPTTLPSAPSETIVASDESRTEDPIMSDVPTAPAPDEIQADSSMIEDTPEEKVGDSSSNSSSLSFSILRFNSG